jgi:hypothetical protein
MVKIIYADASINHFDSMIRLVITDGNDRKAKQKSFNGKIDIGNLEFMGVWLGLRIASHDSIIYTDSLHVANVMNNKEDGFWVDQEMFLQAMNIKKQKNCKVEWIPREKNLAGIDLEKRLKDLSFNPVFKRNVKKFGINHASYKIHRK